MRKKVATLPTSRTTRNDRGFTLLEVLIAVAILSISLGVLFGSQSRSLDYAMEASFNFTAPMLAAKKFAELEAMQSIEDNEGNFGEEYSDYGWKLETEEASFLYLASLQDLQPPIVKATLTVFREDTSLSCSLIFYGQW
ncbi:type IV pilus modification PilV family protein [Desulforhopalus singaporensis]|uniref:N-terminal methylation site-containing protein n=1 Tax=Desulforhopalus singaporensis TaxID=91360 RepID=A0A1H0M1T2_9BACT|nr:prepilin-type N-terminal cleavage/methylation domain-containing protein [Desulforhopalus singaporensis]SDO74355.1 N-terminal methylation site-containing protein [Desulforhopalus singaporensis]